MKKITYALSLLLFLASCAPIAIAPIEPESVMPVITPVKSTLDSPETTLMSTDISEGQNSQCLSPLKEFEYPLVQGDPLPGWLPDEPENYLPSQEWLKITKQLDASQLTLVQLRGDETVFWLDTNQGVFARYKINKELWNTGAIFTGPVSGNFSFFVDQESNVWKARYNGIEDGEKHPEALLSYYNEQKNQWEPMVFNFEDQDSLGIRHITVDSEGAFWFLAINKTRYQLYGFDPSTRIIKRYLADYLVSPPFVLSHNTLFILADHSEKGINSRYMLIKYALDKGTVKTYQVPTRLLSYAGQEQHLPDSLFVDSQQRVWFGTRGWFMVSPDDVSEWHVIVPNSVFIDVVPGAGMWAWGEAKLMRETSDGLLWYSSLRGTGWVDPKVGKWCVFTSYQSNVLSDSQGHLWILADGWLYRHE